MDAEMIAQLSTSTVVVVAAVAETEIKLIIIISRSSSSNDLVLINKNIIKAQIKEIGDASDLMMIIIPGDDDATEQLHHAFEHNNRSK